MRHDPKIIEANYVNQEALVKAMEKLPAIELEDLAKLDRIGKYKLIETAWAKCTQEAKVALLKDEHHFVRSSALIASQANELVA